MFLRLNTYVTQKSYVGLSHGMAISNIGSNNLCEWLLDTLEMKINILNN